MADPILIEPDWPHRPAFAVWGLAQDPPIQTATATGWYVPVDLYASVPVELLNGAYVDGFLLAHSWVQDELPEADETLSQSGDAYPRERRTIGLPDDATPSVPPRGEEVPVAAAPPKVPARKPRRTRRQVTE